MGAPGSCALPLAVLTYEGRVLNTSVSTGARGNDGRDPASAVLVILVIVAAAGFILRHGHLIAVLAVQSVLLAAAGERTPVLAAAVAVPLVVTAAGQRPSRHQARAVAMTAVIVVLAITGLRAETDRAIFYRDSGLSARLGALTSGLAHGTSSQGGPGLIAQAAARLDADSWTAAIIEAEHFGQPRLPASGVASSLLLVIPSALWPGNCPARA